MAYVGLLVWCIIDGIQCYKEERRSKVGAKALYLRSQVSISKAWSCHRGSLSGFDGRGEGLTSPNIIFDEQSGTARFCERMVPMCW